MSGLQIQTTQNPHTQAAAKPSTNLHGFGDIKAYVQHLMLYFFPSDMSSMQQHTKLFLSSCLTTKRTHSNLGTSYSYWDVD